MLHSVDDVQEASLANWRVSRKRFAQLLDVLDEEEITTTHFRTLSSQLASISSSRQVILTFDDCPKHLLEFAVPELVRRKMTAAFYMPTAYIGGYNAWDVKHGAARLELMNDADLKELTRLGMEVGAHGHQHVPLAALPTNENVLDELRQSKQVLEEITGERLVSFAYPYGSVPAGYKTLMAKAGYAFGVGIYHPVETRFALRRFGVYEKDTAQSLRRKLSTPYRLLRIFYDAIKKN